MILISISGHEKTQENILQQALTIVHDKTKKILLSHMSKRKGRESFDLDSFPLVSFHP
jgi:hypothetical protein